MDKDGIPTKECNQPASEWSESGVGKEVPEVFEAGCPHKQVKRLTLMLHFGRKEE